MWKGIIEDGEEIFIYLDSDPADKEEEIDHTRWYGEWADLPDLLLEEIFSYLDIKSRYYASLVCTNWYKIFHHSRVWHHLTIDDRTLTRRKFNYYMGYQYVLDHLRMQSFMTKVGNMITSLNFTPMVNFFNLYEFMNIFFYYHQKTGQYCSKIKSLKFTFNCNLNRHGDKQVFGTGGQLLESLKRLMDSLTNLKHLELNNLLLSPEEAQSLLDEVCYECCGVLRTLRLTNVTEVPFELLHVGTFVNLRELIISPQSLGDDVIKLLGWTRLTDLFIYQNDYTHNYSNIDPKSWKVCKARNRTFRVHLWTERNLKTDHHINQDKQLTFNHYFPLDAPVTSIVYDSSFIPVSVISCSCAADYYGNQLRVFGHLKLPRYQTERSFSLRSDTSLVNMCQTCPNLKTLLIRERISTSTVLLIAYTAKNLKHLYIRKNAVILRADWPQGPEWSDEFYSWLCQSSSSYTKTEEEVSKLLGYPWTALSDKEYKEIKYKNICY